MSRGFARFVSEIVLGWLPSCRKAVSFVSNLQLETDLDYAHIITDDWTSSTSPTTISPQWT